MRRIFKLLVLSIIVAVGILSACTRDNFDMDRLSGQVAYDGSFAIPLVHSDIALYRILDVMDTSIALQDNDEGYLSMVYHSYVESKRVQDLLRLEGQTFYGSISFSDFSSRGMSESGYNCSKEDYIHFTFLNEDEENFTARIDSIALKSGVLEYNISSPFGKKINFDLEFPAIRRNGQPLRDSFTLLSSDHNGGRTLSLEGYTIDLTTTANKNEIPVRVNVQMEFDGTIPSPSDDLSFEIGVRDFNYKGMYGYFGNNKLLIQSDTISVTMFRNNEKYDWEHARFYFVNPKISVKYWNSYGIPSRFYFTEFDVHTQRNDVTLDMSHIAGNSGNFPFAPPSSELGRPLDLNSALVPGYEAEGEVVADANNSNIDQIVPDRPIWIHFAAKAETNPETASWNFIDEDSRLRAKVEIEIPLYGYLHNFTYKDTADIDISQYVGNLPISRMAIIINIGNNMPIKASAQFYLVDEYYNVLDSLISNPDNMIINASDVDAYGNLIGEGVVTTTKIELTKSQIEHLSGSKHLLTKITSSTAGESESGGSIKLYRNYGFKLNIGVDTDLDVEGNINHKNGQVK